MDNVIVAATKYTDVRRSSSEGRRHAGIQGVLKQGKGPGFKIRKSREARINFEEWFHREMKDGGMLRDHLKREKAATGKRWRKAAQHGSKFRQNNNSDFRKLATIPARDYYRWLKEDPDFWKDNNNLKSLRRDNDELRHCIHV